MLEHTFRHIPGVGPRTEEDLWCAGCHTWDDALQLPDIPQRRRLVAMEPFLIESQRRREQRDLRWFADRLPVSQHWRLFTLGRPRTAYVDIETTGLDALRHHITTIALYDGQRIRHYVHDQNLRAFVDDIAGYDLLITFNGKGFDVPFIEEALNTRLTMPHIDLRYVLAQVGYRGGLKRIEKAMGFDRGDLADIDGFFAVVLWQDYVRHDNVRALETLLAYNIADTVNMEALMVHAHNLLTAGLPFGYSLRLAVTEPPPNPFTPDMSTVRRLRASLSGWW